MKMTLEHGTLELVEGDITELAVDAIVNPANAQLVLGGGVAGAIRKKGGPAIQLECDRLDGISVGEAVITGAGTLKARHVIHAVGPRMGEGQEDEKLKNATVNALRVARDHNLASIAFPAISAGIFGFPIGRCAKIMLDACIAYLKTESPIHRIVFCLFGADSFAAFAKALQYQMQQNA